MSIFLHVFDSNNAVQRAVIESLKAIGDVLDMVPLIKIIKEYESGEAEFKKELDKQEGFLFEVVHVFIQSNDTYAHSYLEQAKNFCQSPDDQVRGGTGFLLCALYQISS